MCSLLLIITLTSVTVSPSFGVTFTATGTVAWSASALLTTSSPATVMVMSASVVFGVKVVSFSRESATPSTLAATIPTAPAASRPPVSQGQMAALVSVAPIHHGVETAPPPNA